VKSVEAGLLAVADALLDEAADHALPLLDRTDARLGVLEVVASAYAGWDAAEYWPLTPAGREPQFSLDPRAWADKILSAIHETPIPVALALAALAREVLPPRDQRTTGAYYTDWRLAQLLAEQAVSAVGGPGPWVDPACGTGVLLAAVAMAVPEPDRNALIRDRLVGADLSPRALRGALIAVASLTSDLTVVAGFAPRLILQDSLRSPAAWAQLAPHGAALVIANPPWEKLTVSKHELARGNGADRHYGQSFADEVDPTTPKQELMRYVEQVAAGTRLQGKGSHDLYKLFLELGIGLTAPGGTLAFLVPAGLIRAQGTETLREELDTVTTELSVSVIENRARHFAIDTRFKFLALVARVGDGLRAPVALRVADRTGALPAEAVTIDRAELVEVRPDRSLPEVRSNAEWALFSTLTRNAVTVGDASGPWRPIYRREVDMTLDAGAFVRTPAADVVPVLEGRHVTHFRNRSKSYVSGEGRAAIWKPERLSSAPPAAITQWFIPRAALRPDAASRVGQSRVGFCDITGQTNERTMLAARVPAGYVCGNKVPTLLFPDGGANTEDLFLALANSFVVDWMLRRLVTTTVNLFLLESLPLPCVDVASAAGMELIGLARVVAAAEGDARADLRVVGRRRARMDALVASAWGISLAEMELVMRDFPLLDRGQPPLAGEHASTVTRDMALGALAVELHTDHPSIRRAEEALARGAVPYIGAEYVQRKK
jgi:hypothetical protein